MSLERARLMPRKDEAKELVRPDAFQASSDAIQKWLKDNQRLLVIAGVVAVIGGAVVTFALTRKQSEREKATEEFSQALAFYDKSDEDAKKLSDDDWQTQVAAKFTTLTEKYPNSGPGRLSDLYLARLATDKNAPADAEKFYRAFFAHGGESADVAALTHLALATTLEDQGKLDDAAGEYNKLIPPASEKSAVVDKKEQKTPLVDQALFGAARVAQKLGRPEEARADYDRLMKEFPTSAYKVKAQAALQTLPAAPAAPTAADPAAPAPATATP